MRLADGSDLLGANDARNASIGIIYVAPGDDRPSVLEAILMQDKLGRTQVVLVLSENSRAFQRPVDFDGLKNMRRGLKAEIVFVAPGIPGPAEWARQRRFTVYTSLDSYKSALRAESPDNGNAKKGLFNRKPKLVPNVNAPAPSQSFDEPAPPQPLVAPMIPVSTPSPITTVPSADDAWRRHSRSSQQDIGSYVAPVVPMTEDESAKPVRPQPKTGPIPIPLHPGPRGDNKVASPPAKSGSTAAGTINEKQMSDEQIIYLDPNDELTRVREKIEAVPARRIIMVMPQQTQLRSNVGWRLLHARASELRKEIQVISPDRQVRAVAKAAGFRVGQPHEGSSTGKMGVPQTQPPPSQRGVPERSDIQRQRGPVNRGPNDSRAARQREPLVPPSLREEQPIVSQTETRPPQSTWLPQENPSSRREEPGEPVSRQEKEDTYQPMEIIEDEAFDQPFEFRIDEARTARPLAARPQEEEPEDPYTQDYDTARRIRELAREGTSGGESNPPLREQEPASAFPHSHYSTPPEPIQADPFENDIEELSPSLISEQRGATFSPDMHDIAPDVADLPTDVHKIEDIEAPSWLDKLDKMGNRSISSPTNTDLHPSAQPEAENPPTNLTRLFSPGSSRLPQRELRIKVWKDENADDNAPGVANIPNDAHKIALLPQDDSDGLIQSLPTKASASIKHRNNSEEKVVAKPATSSIFKKTSPPPEAPKIINHMGEVFGNYRLISKIASGNLGDVYLGEHVQLGRNAALKLLSDHIDGEEFQNGMRRLARLIHPNIVRILDFDLKNLIPFLVMDYAPNGTLRHKYSDHGLVPPNIIVGYVKQAANALQYAHDHNIVFGNVQPDNMLIGSNNEILLGGLDSAFIDSTKEDVTSIGMYTAPEQASGKTLPASDQYALGVIVYEWLCGQPPLSFNLFENHHEKVIRLVSSPPTSLLQKIPSVSPEVGEIVMKALAKEPKQRFESVQEFADALEHAISPGEISHGTKHIGQKFGKYRLISLLGEGGFADVYRGQHIHLNTSAAVKILHTKLANEDVEAFRTEARILAKLTHPNIVRVLDFEVEDGIPFLVMDHAPHGTLRQRYPKGSRLPLNIIVSYVKQVANALQYAHDQKLIHRDVKPQNMLFGYNNEILLSDFGIAVVAHSSRSVHTEKWAGTVYYIAPEQCQGKPQRASDQYSLAAVVYEWLTGTCPFTGNVLEIIGQHLTAAPSSLRLKNPTIPSAVEQVVMIALDKDPNNRFASVQAFAKALEEASKQ